MRQIIVALALITGASATLAQSQFTGFYGQIGTGYETNSVNYETATVYVSPVDGPTDTKYHPHGSGNGSYAPLVVTAGYNAAITDKFLLGLGVDYMAISPPKYLGNKYGTNADNGTQVGYKVSQRYSIYLTPGYSFDSDKLLYLKAGYSNQKVQDTDDYPGSDTPAYNLGYGRASGYVLGAGYKQIISGGLYGYVEGNYYSYQGAKFSNTNVVSNTGNGTNYLVTNLAPVTSAYNFLIGLGYRF